MRDLLLKLGGLQPEELERVSGVAFRLRNLEWLGWLIVAGVLLGALTFWSYWRDAREQVQGRRQKFLIALRLTLLAVLLLVVLRPVLAVNVESSVRGKVVVLVDTSASMNIKDPRTTADDVMRGAIGRGTLDPRRGLEQSAPGGPEDATNQPSRLELAKSVLKNPSMALLARLRRDLDVEVHEFGDRLGDALSSSGEGAADPTKVTADDWIGKLTATTRNTAIGDTLRELLARKRGQSLAGVVMITDGASNSGSPALEGAKHAARDGVPLYLYGVGVTSPRDVIVSSLLTQEVAFVGEGLPVTVRVRSQGSKDHQAALALSLRPVAGGAEEPVANQTIELGESDDRVISIPFTPGKAGEFILTAKIDPHPTEVSRENNSVSQRVRVTYEKLRVLYVETTPRWEFRYLQAILSRDRRLDSRFVLLESDESLAAAPGSPFLRRIPTTKEEWFGYDLIILGDLSLATFTQEQQSALQEFVQKFGGALLFIAGPRHAPASYQRTAIDTLLPVELDRTAGTTALSSEASTSFAVELTPQGRTSPFLRVLPDETENARTWAALNRLYWSARVSRAKPAAQVLLVDAEATRGNRHGKLVLAAMQQVGLGQVFYLGTDNTWRWRRNAGDAFHAQFWRQLTQKLGLHRALRGSKRTQLSAEKQSYAVGERVVVYARLYGPDFTPVQGEAIEAGFVIAGEDTEHPISMRALPDQPGMYRAEFMASTPAFHRFHVTADPATKLEFEVREVQFESGETAMNEPLLRSMAELSGGRFFREENIFELPAALTAKTERLTNVIDAELWASPLVFGVLLLLASVEWWLRKRWFLK